METYMAVSITNYGETPELSYGYVYISTGKLTTQIRVDYETGRKQLARLAKALGKAPEMVANQYNRSIFYYQLRGFIN